MEQCVDTGINCQPRVVLPTQTARLMQNCMNGINTGGAVEVEISMSKIYSVNEVIFKMGIFPCTKLHFQQEGCMRKPPA